MCEFLDQVEKSGEDNLTALMTSLFRSGRNDDAVRAAADREYRRKLFKEFGIH